MTRNEISEMINETLADEQDEFFQRSLTWSPSPWFRRPSSVSAEGILREGTEEFRKAMRDAGFLDAEVNDGALFQQAG